MRWRKSLADRFGPIPDPVNNLLYQLRVKALALIAGIKAVITEADQIKIRKPDNLALEPFSCSDIWVGPYG